MEYYKNYCVIVDKTGILKGGKSMKNLYIYSFRGNNITKEIVENVKQKKDGKIVEIKDEIYNLRMGRYKRAGNLNKYICQKSSGIENKIYLVEYMTLEEDSVNIPDLINPFIDQNQEEILRLQIENERLSSLLV